MSHYFTLTWMEHFPDGEVVECGSEVYLSSVNANREAEYTVREFAGNRTNLRIKDTEWDNHTGERIIQILAPTTPLNKMAVQYTIIVKKTMLR